MERTQTQETLYQEALRLLRENGTASTSFFQRKLYIGYAAAREIVDRLLDEGVAVRKSEFTIVINREGERNMRKTGFMGMEAQDILSKVIEVDAAGTERPSFYKLSYRQYLELAKQGYKEAFAHLESIAMKKAERATTLTKRQAACDERDFWETVQFMVAEHYYNLGDLSYEKHIGYMLAFGIGCDTDRAQGINMMLSDMRRTLGSLDIDVRDRLIAACVKHGKRYGVLENMLLLAVIKADTQKVDEIVSGVAHLGIECEVVSRTSAIFHSKVYDAKREGGAR